MSVLRGDAAAQEISSPSSMYRTLYSIMVFGKMRPLRCLRAFRESTIRSVPHGGTSASLFEERYMHSTQEHSMNPAGNPILITRRYGRAG